MSVKKPRLCGRSDHLVAGDNGAMSDTGPLTASQWLRLTGNVMNLSTPLGLLVATVGGAMVRRGPRGLILGERYRLPFPFADAFTIGNVLIARRDWKTMQRQYPDLLRHEEAHTWQYLYCLGLPFYPAYGACMLWSMLRTGDRAAGNFFERRAGLDIGGYRELPVVSMREGLRALLRPRTPRPS
jgi:hypothetical protein